MLGIFFIYFIGKYFYKLAEDFNQNKWLYAILGVIVYYGGTAIAGFFLGFLDVLFDLGMDWENNILNVLIGLPFGVGAVCLFYFLLKRKWEKTFVVEDEIQDIGISED